MLRISKALLVVLTLVFVADTAIAQQRLDPRRRTLERVAKPITVAFEEDRLEDVLEFLATIADIDIEAAWEDDRLGYGLDRQAEITVSATQVPILIVVERVLEKAQDNFDANTWQLTPAGALEVGPKSRLNRRQTLKVYDIQDLLFEVPDYAQVPELDLESALDQSNSGQGGGGGGGRGGGIFDDPETTDLDSESEQDRAQRIIDLIVEFVEPDQWLDNGGEGGTIRYYRGNLLIRAPDYMHRQVGGYDFWPRSVPKSVDGRAEQYRRAEARREAKEREQRRASQTPAPSSADQER
jgi:hypothetical protein